LNILLSHESLDVLQRVEFSLGSVESDAAGTEIRGQVESLEALRGFAQAMAWPGG